MNLDTHQHYRRSFVPVDADMGDWSAIEPLFDRLDGAAIDTPEQLERWLLDQSELSACISEESSARYAAMTCYTDDPVKEQAYLHFVEEIAPRCKPRWHRLYQRYTASPARQKLPRERYFVLDRSVAAAVELYRDENVPLQTEDTKLDQQYQKLCGAMTVEFEGREQTLQQLSKYQEEPDRALRQKTWELTSSRRLQDREPLDEIFDQMVALRDRMAHNADLANFRDYQFKAYERFDYGPADCMAFHDAIAELVVPAKRELMRERQAKLGVDPLRPWDVLVDPENRPRLKPFETPAQLCSKCSKVFHALDAELGGQFDGMIKARWLDLDSRKGKAPGGYQLTYDESRRPFIFMNAVGRHRDVETLLHEGGHAFHAIACREDPLVQYRHCSMEMAEVASMGMELLAQEHLDAFYSGADLVRARREQFEGILNAFPWIAIIDAFQHWSYTHPTHTREERTQQWLTLLERFGGPEDWTGYEDVRASMWQRQLHLYGVPFYYIEYGIAQIGALQLWQNFRHDRKQALSQYRHALSLGGSRPLPELWAAGGLSFDFSAKTLAPLIKAVVEELERLK